MERYGIIANPVSHSLTPAMYRAGFEALGMEASCEAFDVGEDGLKEFMEKFRSGNVGNGGSESPDDWRGFAVSSPHKEAIIPLLDRLHPMATAIGAVNTVRVVRSHEETPKASLVGYNTDWIGVTRALEERVGGDDSRIKALRWKKALVIGAGGAARAAVYALKEVGMHVYITNRTPERAQELAKFFGAAYLDFSFSDPASNGYPCESFDVVVNATTVGLGSAVSPVPIHFWEEFGNGIALDFVYRVGGKAGDGSGDGVSLTRFLQEADRAGWETISGGTVLARQGAEQFALLSGRPIDVAVFDRVVS